MRRTIYILITILLWSCTAWAATYLEDDFDGYSDSPANHGWGLPDTFSVVDSDSPNGGKALMCTISQSGTLYWAGIDPRPGGVFADGYIGFWVKITSRAENVAGGNKFLKLFSADYFTSGGSTAANTTFGQVYGSGIFSQVSHGNGSSTINDTQSVFEYDGSKDTAVGDITGYTSAFYLCDGEWHWWECRVKLNTDNNADGAYSVWVDGVNKISVVNVKNRHNDNTRDWSEMSLVNYAGSTPPSTYYVYFDAITTSDSYIGVPGSTTPAPPTISNATISNGRVQ